VIDPKRAHKPSMNEQIARSPSQRTGFVDPGFINLAGSEQDYGTEGFERGHRHLRSQNSEFEPNEEYKTEFQDVTSNLVYSKGKESPVGLEEDFKLPFRIYRPCSYLTKTKDTNMELRGSSELTKDSIYFNTAVNLDAVNNADGKFLENQAERDKLEETPLYTNNLLKKIFKDIDIYAKITEH
jgi:hypothetical protein